MARFYRVLIAGALALVSVCVYADLVTCTPTRLNQTVSGDNDSGMWGAYVCEGKTYVFACTAGNCSHAVLNAVSYLASTGADTNAVNWALKKYSAGSPCTPEIKNVWWQDRWKFKQHLGLTDNQIAAICPLASK